VPPDVVAALESLPENCAHALRLRLLGLNTKEIAAVLGISEPAVWPLLRVADSKLRAALDTPPAITGSPTNQEQGEGK
jgi:DNA-directed RNA polymerase specialized sigma24 family protein